MQAINAFLSAEELKALCINNGADDAGVVALDRAELDDQRKDILAFYPGTKTLLSYVCRMNREPVRSPLRSVANTEFHHTGDWVNEIGHRIVAALENQGIRAINPPMAFPMEMDRWPEKMWTVSHKPVAVAAGLGKMGIHRNVIHPKFGNFVLLGIILLAEEVADATQSRPLDYNPCLECMLCVAACPVGAIGKDGSFDFSACYHHNYREFMGGFDDWIGQVVESRNRTDYHRKVTPAETVSVWQSLGFGPNYKSAYCMAVCPAGEDVVQAYKLNKAAHTREILRPLQEKEEALYVIPGSDAEAYARKRYPHKVLRPVRTNLLPRRVEGFLQGLPLTFQPGASEGLDACYHFVFAKKNGDKEPIEATVVIRNREIEVRSGLHGSADLVVRADAETWMRFVRGEASIVAALLFRKIRLRGPLRLLQRFGRCFPSGR